MKILDELSIYWSRIVALFIGAILFVLIRFLYHFFLFQERIIDKPLTKIIIESSAKTISFITDKQLEIYEADEKFGDEIIKKFDIYYNNKKVLGMADACNGLNFILFYFIFILILKSDLKTKIGFSILGIISIEVLNVLRNVLLGLNQLYNPAHSFFFPHHFIFNVIILALIYSLWYKYAKIVKAKINE
jgi:exosortase/archaeosortase family protein